MINGLIFNLGYGGYIHNIKNYVLRRDDVYYKRALKNYEVIKYNLDLLKENKNLTRKVDFINVVNVVEQYHRKLYVIRSMIAEGKTIEEIDRKVKVEDSIAIDSLYRFAQDLHQRQMTTLNLALQRKAQLGQQFGMWMFALVIVLVIGIVFEYKTILKVSEGTKSLFTNIFDELKIPIMIIREDGDFRYGNSAALKFWNKTFDNEHKIEDKWFDFLFADKMTKGDVFETNNDGAPITLIKRFEDAQSHIDSIYEVSLNLIGKDFMTKMRHGIISINDRTKLIDDNTKSEIHHRVKNNLSLLIGLVEMIKRDTKDNEEAREIMDILTSKIYSISTMYDNEQEISIHGQINVKKYFTKLIEQHRHFNIYLSINMNLEISDDLFVSPKQMIPLGLIFSEFLVNSIKHADAGNSLVINAKVFMTNNGMICELKDNGQSSCEQKEKKATGLGRKIIDILAMQIDSEVEISIDKGCRLRLFPNEGKKVVA